ncbi:fibronectin type III domain-containing protein [Planctomycetota bacterium]|nr:fibronectin type III domain-containing protein [Planctomycetota bacterium]
MSSTDLDITSVTCTKGGSTPSFKVDLSAQGQYSVTLEVPGVHGTSSVSGDHGTWTASSAMSNSTSYSIQAVMGSGGQGHQSQAVPVLFFPPTNVSAAFDGANLVVSWTPPAGKTQPTSSTVKLVNSNGNQSATTKNANSVSMVVHSSLLDGTGWTVTVTPMRSQATGPRSSQASVTQPPPPDQQAPAVASLRVTALTPTQLVVTVSTPVPKTPAAHPYFIAVVDWRATQVTTSPSTAAGTPVMGFYSFDVTLTGQFDASRVYTLSLCQASGADDKTVGTTGLGMELLLAQPQEAQVTVNKADGQWEVTVAVQPPPGPSLPTGALVGLRDATGAPIEGTEVGGSGFANTITRSAIDSGTTAYGAVLRGSDVGPVGATRWPLITSAPTILGVQVDGETIYANWSPVEDSHATGTLLIARSGGAELARGVFQGDCGRLDVPGLAGWDERLLEPELRSGDDDVVLLARRVGLNTTGPSSEPVSPIIGSPSERSARYAASGGPCQLTWEASEASDPSATYAVEILQGDHVVHLDTSAQSPYEVPAEQLNSGGGFSFRVRETQAGSVQVTGPWSREAAILTGTPQGLQVDTDGATLTARFAPVPGATGYRLALVKAGEEQGDPWYTAQPQLRVPLDFAAAGGDTLTVQAVAPDTAGPPASARVFQPGWYPQFETASEGQVQWLNPATASDMAAHEIRIGLPDLFPAPPPTPLPSEAPFSLHQAAAGSAYTYTLTIANDLPWAFTGPAIRGPLYEHYQEFLAKLETAGATPTGVQTVQAAIARSMPQTFAETLLYTYGFTGPGGYVDLVPGMVLRVEYQGYQTLGRTVPCKCYLDGFITSAVAEYTITSDAWSGPPHTALDGFIGLLTAQAGTEVTSPVASDDDREPGAGGLIDTGISQMRQPFLRLVYPSSLDFATGHNHGTPEPWANPVILAAGSLSMLQKATDALRRDNPVTHLNVGTLYFRGRPTLVPQLQVWLDGAPIRVPLGSTVADLLRCRAMNPPAMSLPLSGLQMRRGVAAALVGAPPEYDAGGAVPVRLDWVPAAHSALTALPLLGGDSLTLGAHAVGGAR